MKGNRSEEGDRSSPHGHIHGAVDPVIFTTQRGIWAVKWSLIGLLATALFQVVVVWYSGSVALLADTIHNFADAATAIPLWIAFRLARWKPTRQFTYGYGRVEDLAGMAIVLIIFANVIFAGYQSFDRLLHPQTIGFLWAVVIASLVGFVGNEAIARFRINIGREIGSAALVAEGFHARVDALTSLVVLFGAVGVFLGYPIADAVAGLFITVMIIRIVWVSGKTVFTRMLDGVDAKVVEEIEEAACRTPGVLSVTEARVRWLGHRLHAEVSVAVDPGLSVEEGHEIVKEVQHTLLHSLKYLSNATIHVDPASAPGEEHHCVVEHAHDDLPPHSH